MEERIFKVNMDALKRVREVKGCLCKFGIIDGEHKRLPCPCDDIDKIDIGQSCHCRVYTRV